MSLLPAKLVASLSHANFIGDDASANKLENMIKFDKRAHFCSLFQWANPNWNLSFQFQKKKKKKIIHPTNRGVRLSVRLPLLEDR